LIGISRIFSVAVKAGSRSRDNVGQEVIAPKARGGEEVDRGGKGDEQTTHSSLS